MMLRYFKKETRSAYAYFQTKRTLNPNVETKNAIMWSQKGSIKLEDIIMKNIHTSNFRVPKFINQILLELKTEIDNNTIIWDFYNSFK